MATKTCPSCGVEVPVSANRCKDCFHDFDTVQMSKTGPIALLVAVAFMAVAGALTFWIVSTRPIEERILVDEATHSVVFVTKFRTGEKTDRLRWDDIGRLESITNANGSHEIVAVTLKGERVVIESSPDTPLTSTAEHYSQLMDKPLEILDKTRGFHKMSDGEE